MFNLIKKHQKRKEYRKYIYKHKQNILRAFYEMTQCKDLEWIIKDPAILEPLWIRALEHDDSKYDIEEFEAYRKHYFPINKKEFENNEQEYLKAWEHHKKCNDHHWQSRINWKDEDFNIKTELACLENLMDWLAVGYEFGNRPVDYYEKNKDNINLPKLQKDFLEKCIYEGIDKKYILNKENKNNIWNEL